MLEQLLNNHFLYSLSLTLMHFLWQGLLVGFLLKSVLLVIDQKKSSLRYALATLSMVSNLVLALLTFAIIYSDSSSSINNSISPLPLNSLVHELTQESSSFTYQELIPSVFAYLFPYLSIFWLATIVFLSGKLLIDVRNVNLLPYQATVLPTDELLTRFHLLAKQIKLKKAPRLLISMKVNVPMAIGWLKPVVLLPASMVTGLDSAQLEMLLLHELAHIKRHDYLVNFLQTLVELLFFFHPCVHWIGKQMRNEREYCSDDVAVQHCGDAIAYAHTLTDTASLCANKKCHTIPTMAMAASGGDLKARVVRLVNHHCAPSNDKSKWLAALSLLLGIGLIGINQLVTSPLAFQLNTQFPWYETTDIINVAQLEEPTIKITHIESHQNESLTPHIANNSIALQLLNNANVQSEFNPLISNNIIAAKPFDNNSLEKTTIEASPQKNNVALTAKLEKQLTPSSVKALNDTFRANPEPEMDKQLAKQSASSVNEIKNDTATGTQSTTLKKTTVASNTEIAAITHKAVVKTPVTLTEKETQKDETLAASANNGLEHDTLGKNIHLIAAQSTPSDSTNNSNKKIATVPSVQQKASSQQAFNKVPQTYSQAIDEFEFNNSRYNKTLASNNDSATQLHQKTPQLRLKEDNKSAVLNSAKLLNPSTPLYPSVAKRRGLEMNVKVNFTVDKDGRVKDIEFADQHNVTYFKSAIRFAIRKWRFEPATLNNDIVESKMSKIFSFSLQS